MGGPADCRSPPICNLQSAICKLQRAPRRAMVVATSRRPTLCWRTLKAVRTTCSNEAQNQPSVGMRTRSAASFMTITGSTTVAELITSDVCRVAPVERLHDMHVVSSTFPAFCRSRLAACKDTQQRRVHMVMRPAGFLPAAELSVRGMELLVAAEFAATHSLGDGLQNWTKRMSMEDFDALTEASCERPGVFSLVKRRARLQLADCKCRLQLRPQSSAAGLQISDCKCSLQRDGVAVLQVKSEKNVSLRPHKTPKGRARLQIPDGKYRLQLRPESSAAGLVAVCRLQTANADCSYPHSTEFD